MPGNLDGISETLHHVNQVPSEHKFWLKWTEKLLVSYCSTHASDIAKAAAQERMELAVAGAQERLEVAQQQLRLALPNLIWIHF